MTKLSNLRTWKSTLSKEESPVIWTLELVTALVLATDLSANVSAAASAVGKDPAGVLIYTKEKAAPVAGAAAHVGTPPAKVNTFVLLPTASLASVLDPEA